MGGASNKAAIISEKYVNKNERGKKRKKNRSMSGIRLELAPLPWLENSVVLRKGNNEWNRIALQHLYSTQHMNTSALL